MKKNILLLFVCFLLSLSAVNAADSVNSLSVLNHKSGKLGKYQALIIGLDKYRDSGFRKIPTTSGDLKKLASLLESKYGFSVQTLFNSKATKAAIESSLNQLITSAGMNDNILIYFAGHGEFTKTGDQGWWIPYDGTTDNDDTWLSNTALIEMVRDIKAKDVLIIADAAFSDSVFGSSHKYNASSDMSLYLNYYNNKSRWCLKSGNKYTLSDASGKTIVAPLMYDILKNHDKPYLMTIEMYEKMKQVLRKNAGQFPPRCRSLRYTGDQGGEFVFVSTMPVKKKVDETVKPEKKEETSPPKPVTGKIRLDVNITGAIVTIDGNKAGKTPVPAQTLKPGTHLLKVTKAGYQPYLQSVDLASGSSVILQVKLEKELPKTGTVVIETVPDDAEIKLINTNKSFSNGMDLDPGRYKVQINRLFYRSQELTFDIVAGKEIRKTVTLKPVDEVKTKDLGAFVRIKKGSYPMGSPESESRRSPDETQHPVILTRDFYMQTTEVTVAQWRAFVKASNYKSEAEAGAGAFAMVEYNWEKDRFHNWDNPGFTKNDNHPVTSITWNDAMAFAKWMNEQSDYTFRLPTEAEWEYACRAGTTDPFYTGKCITREQATYDGNSKWNNCPVGSSVKGTTEVKSYSPNRFGLFDMHGNVREWCQDWYGNYPEATVQDPTGADAGTRKVCRGGDWLSYQYNIRSAKRFDQKPGDAYSHTGFRLVIEP